MTSAVEKDPIVLAVDIGGTKTAASAITLDGRILSRQVEPTLQDGPTAGIQQLIAMLERLAGGSGANFDQILGIGIGIPAVLEPDTDFIIWGPNLKDWKQVDLRGELEERFHLPVCVEYDGHTAVLGEWWRGAAQGYKSFVNIIIGTGVGGGMVLDGRLIRGVNRLAGAVGWFTLDAGLESHAVHERALGSWESRIAGPGIARRAQRLLRSAAAGHSSLASKGDRVTAQDVFRAAQQGDSLAGQLASQVADSFGRGIANIISLVNPELVILGGSVGSHADFLIPEIEGVARRYAQPISCQSVKIIASQLGVDAGLYGAAYGLILRLKMEERTKGGGQNPTR